MKVRIPMIVKRSGFKQISFNTGVYQGGLYVVEQSGVGILYKHLK
jgi:hypothetical protein